MQDAHDSVLRSLVREGIRVSKLKLAALPDTGRGLQATKDIRRDEILLTIPPRYLLNLKVVGPELGFDWRKSPLPAHVALSLYILGHKSNSKSPLSDYIHSLPKSFETVPLTWDTASVELLPESARAYLRKQQTVYEKHFILAQTFLDSHEGLRSSLGATLDRADFQWAWLVVNSRCIYQSLSPTSSRDDNYACSPLIDMINHVPSAIAHCKLSYDIKGLSVISQTSYKQGAEVFISYGAHSNEALLCEYGFVVPRNSDNTLLLDASISKMLLPHHTRLLMEMGYFEDYTLDHDGIPSFRTEVALRTALLEEKECEEGSDGCRRLTQFVNGYTSGRAEEAGMNELLKGLLMREMDDTEVGLDRVDGQEGDIAPLVRQLWRDRQDILRSAMRRLQGPPLRQ